MWEPKKKFIVKLESEPHCPELQHFSTEAFIFSEIDF